jgi:hypothetical protein
LVFVVASKVAPGDEPRATHITHARVHPQTGSDSPKLKPGFASPRLKSSEIRRTSLTVSDGLQGRNDRDTDWTHISRPYKILGLGQGCQAPATKSLFMVFMEELRLLAMAAAWMRYELVLSSIDEILQTQRHLASLWTQYVCLKLKKRKFGRMASPTFAFSAQKHFKP